MQVTKTTLAHGLTGKTFKAVIKLKNGQYFLMDGNDIWTMPDASTPAVHQLTASGGSFNVAGHGKTTDDLDCVVVGYDNSDHAKFFSWDGGGVIDIIDVPNLGSGVGSFSVRWNGVDSFTIVGTPTLGVANFNILSFVSPSTQGASPSLGNGFPSTSADDTPSVPGRFNPWRLVAVKPDFEVLENGLFENVNTPEAPIMGDQESVWDSEQPYILDFKCGFAWGDRWIGAGLDPVTGHYVTVTNDPSGNKTFNHGNNHPIFAVGYDSNTSKWVAAILNGANIELWTAALGAADTWVMATGTPSLGIASGWFFASPTSIGFVSGGYGFTVYELWQSTDSGATYSMTRSGSGKVIGAYTTGQTVPATIVEVDMADNSTQVSTDDGATYNPGAGSGTLTFAPGGTPDAGFFDTIQETPTGIVAWGQTGVIYIASLVEVTSGVAWTRMSFEPDTGFLTTFITGLRVTDTGVLWLKNQVGGALTPSTAIQARYFDTGVGDWVAPNMSQYQNMMNWRTDDVQSHGSNNITLIRYGTNANLQTLAQVNGQPSRNFQLGSIQAVGQSWDEPSWFVAATTLKFYRMGVHNVQNSTWETDWKEAFGWFDNLNRFYPGEDGVVFAFDNSGATLAVTVDGDTYHKVVYDTTGIFGPFNGNAGYTF